MTDLETRLGRFTNKTRAEEQKASTWIGRHPGWTLAIGVVLLLGDLVLAIKVYG